MQLLQKIILITLAVTPTLIHPMQRRPVPPRPAATGAGDPANVLAQVREQVDEALEKNKHKELDANNQRALATLQRVSAALGDTRYFTKKHICISALCCVGAAGVGALGTYAYMSMNP